MGRDTHKFSCVSREILGTRVDRPYCQAAWWIGFPYIANTFLTLLSYRPRSRATRIATKPIIYEPTGFSGPKLMVWVPSASVPGRKCQQSTPFGVAANPKQLCTSE